MMIDEPEWWEQWTYFDKEALETRLKEDAPAEVRADWERIQKEHGIKIEKDEVPEGE